MDHSSGKAVSSNKNLIGCPEESGWTSYFEDFSKGIEPSYNCSSVGGSSLVSDADSCAAWKFSHQNHLVSFPSVKGSAPNLPKKLSFKKARGKQISKDDPLEDTASSPVNSPKGQGFTSSEHYSELQTDDEHQQQLNFNGKNIGCTDLKKRGLCLVPLSMLVNNLG